jgi:TonB family protein
MATPGARRGSSAYDYGRTDGRRHEPSFSGVYLSLAASRIGYDDDRWIGRMQTVDGKHAIWARHGEKRRHKRAKLFSVAYLHLGNGTGGLILNIAEEGMAIRTDIPDTRYLREIRFSIPDTPHCIVCDAEVSWCDTHRKTAGIRLTGLSNSDREKISNWVASQPASGLNTTIRNVSAPEIAETVNTFDFAKFFPAESEVGNNKITPESLGLDFSDAPPVADWHHQVVDPAPAADSPPTSTAYAETVVALPTPDHVEEVEEKPAVSSLGYDLRTSVLNDGDVVHEVPLDALRKQVFSAGEAASAQSVSGLARTHKSRPLLIALGGFVGGVLVATAFVFGVSPLRLSHLLSSPHNSTARQLSVPQQSHLRPSSSATKQATKQRLPVLSTDAIVTKALSQNLHPDSLVVSNGPPPVRSLPEQVKNGETAPQPVPKVSLDVNPTATSKARKPAVLQIALPKRASVPHTPPTSLDNNPEVVKPQTPPGTDTTIELKINTSVQSSSQFAAILMPNGDASQISGDLQIGQLISSRQPEYPAPAAQVGVQGTVKLHATVGTDGNVERVEPLSGPSELIHSAMSAVQNWQFGPTMVAGKPVESERNIVFVFRLMH